MKLSYNECKIHRIISISSVYTAFENTYSNSYVFDGESHDFWEIVCLLDGNLGVTADNSVYFLKKGQIIFHPPGEFHKLWAENGTSPHLAVFSFKAPGMPPLGNKIYNMTVDSLKQISRLIETSKNIFDIEYYLRFTLKPGKEFEAQTFVNALESFILSVISSSAPENVRHKSVSANNYMKIISVLEENIEQNLTVSQIAALCRMSEPSLKKTFFKYSGEGIIHYFNGMKIKKAITLLKNGMSVKEVAGELGFVNQNYFSTVFKRTVGFSPSNYKGNA